MVTLFMQISNRRIETLFVRQEELYARVADFLAEEDVTALAIPSCFARLAKDVYAQFRIPGAGHITCNHEITAWVWATGPGWRTKDVIRRYGAWGHEEALAELEAAIQFYHDGEYAEW